MAIGFAAAAVQLSAAAPTPTRVACVGDSITFGSGTTKAKLDSYPAQLGRMLGAGWDVGNFGVSGATLLNRGDRPWRKQPAFQAAMKFQPQVVIVMLGTNDTKPQNWPFKEEFVADYRALIDAFKLLASKPRIFVCRPVPIVGEGLAGINMPAMREQLPLIEQIAALEKATLLDMNAALADHVDLIPDRVHPNTGGATFLAKAAYRALMGKDFVGEVPPAVETAPAAK